MFNRSILFSLAVLGALAITAMAGTLTIQSSSPGSTPELLAYNAGHFWPGSNTKEWWRYSGVTGARVFLTASLIENVDDIPGYGDGVTDQASFLARCAALRANPNSPTYINWVNFTNRYNVSAKHGANRLQPNYICTELRKLGVAIDVNITASTSFFPITSSADWAGKWELWQHFYAQAFYLGRGFDVERYQMYNEPDHVNQGPVPQADYVTRLQLCSDAIQSALADVNSIYGKSLVPKILAPVDTTSSYGSWAQLVVNNRHLNFLGQTDTNYLVLQQFDYHQYNSTPATFGANLASLRNSIGAAMAPEAPLPVSISEFNVHTAANFDAIPETLDHPTKYPRLGAIFVNLVQNGTAELYNFKFSQTDGDVGDNYPVRKNGMHYVNNDAAPYNIGGITKGGEVWRLFNKAFAPGRERKNFTSSGLSGLAVLASYDPVTARYYVFSANDSMTSASVTVDVSAFNIPDNNRVLIEEVSENYYGTASHYTRVLGGQVTTFTQPANSVWLFTIPTKPQQFISPGVPTLTLNATNDATVTDGANKNTNFGTQTNLVIRNDPANTSNRSAALMKFRLPTIYLPDIQLAVLTVSGATLTANAAMQAHVYGITNNSWSQGAVTWATAPNLSQNIAAGNTIPSQFVNGLGDSAFLQGQLVFSSPSFSEQQLDVTSFIQTRTNYDATFLVSQDPRWNVTLPSLASGDTQPDGMQLISLEGSGSDGPRLLLVRLQDSDGDGISDEAETNIFGTNPNNPDTDGDGVSDGDEILVLHTDPGTNPPPPAPPLAYEPFAYPDNTPLVGQGGWVLTSTATNGFLELGSLDVPGLAPSPSNRLTWNSSSMSLRLPLGTNVASGEIFFSFAVRVDTLGTAMNSDGTLAGFTTNTGTAFGTKINIHANGGGGFNLGVSKGGGTTFGDWSPANFNPGETIFVVGRYTFNGGNATDDLCDLWLNPSPANFGATTAPPATIAGVGTGGTDLAYINHFFFRAGGSTSSPTKLTSDELRVGLTWASVTPPLPPALTIQLAGGNANLLWPTNATGFLLQTTSTLEPPAWLTVTNTVGTSGTNYSVTIAVSDTHCFFRLRR